MTRALAGLAALTPLLLAGCAAVPPAAVAPAEIRPNIILITAEDLSPRIGAYGDRVAVTPNIDRLAAEGVRFTRAFTTAGVCAPSRSALITGVSQETLGTMHMRTRDYGAKMTEGFPYEAVPPAEVKAFPELLRAAGYYTVNDQKTDYQFGDPFTVWDQNRDQAEWNARAPGQPFFLMINHEHTHESRTWPLDTDTKLHPLVANVMKQNARLDTEKAFAPTDPATVSVPAYFPDTPVVRANIARQYDNVRAMDAEVGRLLDRLRAEGRFDDSIIIFMTDHGDGLPRGKRSIFDSGTRIPLIVRFPDKRGAGTVRGDLVSAIDLAPTFLRWAQAPVPKWIQGRDLFGGKAPDAVYMGGDRFDEVPQRFRGVREARYHYIRYYSDLPVIPSLAYQNVNPIMREWRRLLAAGTLTPLQRSYIEGSAPREMLFDTEADPDEVANLVSDPRFTAVKKRLSVKLERWIAASGDQGRVSEAVMTARMWPDGKQPVTAPVLACRLSSGKLRLASPTPGASIGWGGPEGKTNLYATPLVVAAPFTTRAIRYGYKSSEAITVDPAKASAC
jgi:arylsulfatase A-like enzyme